MTTPTAPGDSIVRHLLRAMVAEDTSAAKCLRSAMPRAAAEHRKRAHSHLSEAIALDPTCSDPGWDEIESMERAATVTQ